MLQSNKSLPIQLVSKNDYKNEVMSPKIEFLGVFFMTWNPEEYIFKSANRTVDRQNEYKIH